MIGITSAADLAAAGSSGCPAGVAEFIASMKCGAMNAIIPIESRPMISQTHETIKSSARAQRLAIVEPIPNQMKPTANAP